MKIKNKNIAIIFFILIAFLTIKKGTAQKKIKHNICFKHLKEVKHKAKDNSIAGSIIYCGNCCNNKNETMYFYDGIKWKSIDKKCRDLFSPNKCIKLSTEVANHKNSKKTVKKLSNHNRCI